MGIKVYDVLISAKKNFEMDGIRLLLLIRLNGGKDLLKWVELWIRVLKNEEKFIISWILYYRWNYVLYI